MLFGVAVCKRIDGGVFSIKSEGSEEFGDDRSAS
jgi:hypothetical protein